ncbi:CPBP family intramembrane glutamic endopeptidase [Clostridium polynesiense]|uniref:CPBP family intramembrane glutamic endopeptidase n=1 Tax=Clostridium polynesiense TaxID=1325933 RepID=UPI0009E4F932|nr:CPBP family intramembrane glutamic endopeptidase [Clostridium polynesiense]
MQISGILYLLMALLSLLFYKLIFKLNKKSFFKSLNIRKLSIKLSLLLVLFTIIFSIFDLTLINLIYPMFPGYARVNETITGITQNFSGILAAVIIAAVFEEILFRGLVFKELSKGMNISAAIILQALFFGLAHGNKLQFIYAFYGGIILGLIYYWTNSLAAPILVHFLSNLLGGVVLRRVLYYSSFMIYVYLIAGGVLSILLLIYIYKNKPQKPISFIEESSSVERCQ